MLRLRFDDARDKAITIARENGDGVLAASIRKFQFRDIRPKLQARSSTYEMQAGYWATRTSG
ncbi:hypothetical protein QFZ38_004029 [Pseudomonas cedrina]|nr:hypothetical protein [Pseudomonas cedrina]